VKFSLKCMSILLSVPFGYFFIHILDCYLSYEAFPQYPTRSLTLEFPGELSQDPHDSPPSGISICSAVFAQFTRVTNATDRQTHRPRWVRQMLQKAASPVRPILHLFIHALRPNSQCKDFLKQRRFDSIKMSNHHA